MSHRPGHAVRDQGAEASAKERNDFLIDLLRETRAALIDFMFKQSAVLILVIGWIVSSENARKFVAAAEVRRLGTAGVCIYALLFLYWMRTYSRRSASTQEHLLELQFLPRSYFEPLTISPGLVTSLVAVQLLLCAILMGLLFIVR